MLRNIYLPSIRSHTLLLRLVLIGIAWCFSEIVRYIYLDVLVPQAVYAYMGVRALHVTALTQFIFMLFAVAPSMWLPIHQRRPTDSIQLFLYYAVHIPTCILLPIVAYSPYSEQFKFVIAMLLAFLLLDIRYMVPRLSVPVIRIKPRLFWTLIALLYITAILIFANSGYLSLSNFSLLEVYDQRQELTDRAGEIGGTFFYVANWTGTAFAPFLIIAGLGNNRWHRRLLLVLGGIAIATASFIASSNKANYMAIPAVVVGYLVYRKSGGRYIAIVMGMAFIALAQLMLLVDKLVAQISGVTLPTATWSVFHRTFTNNGYLSAIYLDLFTPLKPALYSDSFLRWLPGAQIDEPIAMKAGASFTDIPGVWANAHLWADGYANLGYAGIAFSALSALFVFWLYDSLSARRDRLVATAALIVPSSIFANTSVHTALISNGVFLTFILVFMWGGSNKNVPE